MDLWQISTERVSMVYRKILSLTFLMLISAPLCSRTEAHGTVVYPVSRVYNVFLANPDNPSFDLADTAVTIDGTLSYYTWNELSRNIAEAVVAGLPVAFDYSPWCPDGQIASGGRVDPASPDYPRTYAGLDQVSADWPTTSVDAGSTITVDFLATAPHDPSVWDVWMTTPDWTPTDELNWAQMEFLMRPSPVLDMGHYTFDLQIPTDRSGHHVIWVAWQRDDPVGEVFFSTSDVFVENMLPQDPQFRRTDCNLDGSLDLSDAVALLSALFPGLTAPPAQLPCEDPCDCNDDGSVNLADAICTLHALFMGTPPAAPYPACGFDGVVDGFVDCDPSVSCP